MERYLVQTAALLYWVVFSAVEEKLIYSYAKKGPGEIANAPREMLELRVNRQVCPCCHINTETS